MYTICMDTIHHFSWHYSRAILQGIRMWTNFVTFFYYYFSIPLLSRTLFSTYGRLGEGYAKGFNIGEWVSTFIVNTLMRVVGFFARSVLILCGLIVITFTVILGLVALVLWIMLPVIVCGMIIYSLMLFF